MEKAEIIKVGVWSVGVACVIVGMVPYHQGEKEIIAKLVTVVAGCGFAGVAATLISWKQEAAADKRFCQALNK